MTLYKWSQTAASNATADSTCPFPEGMAPSALNDGTRGMMAAAAKWRDDMIGANLGTSGTATAYTLSSNQVFDTRAHMAAQALSVFFSVTNGANATLNVDGLGAFPIVTDGTLMAVPAGTLVAGSFYDLSFSNANSVWILKNFYVKPYEMPIGAVMEFYGASVPNSSFAFPNGQAISRTTYATLFALIGTTYGVGDGSTTFNIPDLTGRVTAMKEASATRLTSTYFGGNSTVLGAVGGLESETLTAAQLPSITSNGSISGTAGLAGSYVITQGTAGVLVNVAGGSAGGTAPQVGTAAQTASLTVSGTASVTSNNTSGNAHPNVQPTIICNKIMRII